MNLVWVEDSSGSPFPADCILRPRPYARPATGSTWPCTPRTRSSAHKARGSVRLWSRMPGTGPRNFSTCSTRRIGASSRPGPGAGGSSRVRRLTHEGSRGAEVLVLLSGRAKISIDTEDGRELVLGFCGPGRLVGEFSVIDREGALRDDAGARADRGAGARRRGVPRAARTAARDLDGAASRPRPSLPRRRPDADRVRVRADARAGRGAAGRADRANTASRSTTGSRSRCRSPRRSSPGGRGPRASRPRRRCRRCAAWA